MTEWNDSVILKADLSAIATELAKIYRLPFATESIPGGFAEAAVADHYGGKVLGSHDFVDVVCESTGIGWQVKSTKASTTVTWKRAKIEGSADMIRKSDDKGGVHTQRLGRRVIEACNSHAKDSLNEYDLRQIRYARIISCPGRFTYLERVLIDEHNPTLFDPNEFKWKWSEVKHSTAKEQLQALHGDHRKYNKKWFAWHGRGENQLHFFGDRWWWPNSDPNAQCITLPKYGTSKTWNELLAWLGEEQ